MTVTEAVYGFTDDKKKIQIGTISYDDGSLPVGGRIFYVDPDSDRNVEFYDAQGNVLSDVGVGSTPAYYKVLSEGASGKDKFYIYDNTTGIVEDKYWGYYNINLRIKTDIIGSGKTNTAAILAVEDTSAYAIGSIFDYLVTTQNAGVGVGGCTDWFVGSTKEYDQLRSSELLDGFKNKNIWSSVENGSSSAKSWHSNDKYWRNYMKEYQQPVVFIRSF